MVRFLSRAPRKPASIPDNIVSDFYSALEDKSTNKNKLETKKSSSSTPKSTKKSRNTTPFKTLKKEKYGSDQESQSKFFTDGPYIETSTKSTEPGFQRDNILSGISDSASKPTLKKDNSTSNLAISILEDYSMGSLLPEDTELNSYNKKRPRNVNNHSSTINSKNPKNISASPLIKDHNDSAISSMSSDDPFGFFRTERAIKTKSLPIASSSKSPVKRKPLVRTSTTIAQARSIPHNDNILDDLELVLSTEPKQKTRNYNLRATKSKTSEADSNSEAKLLKHKKTNKLEKSNKAIQDVSELTELTKSNKKKDSKTRLGFKQRKLGDKDYKQAEKNLEAHKLNLVEHFKKIDSLKLEEEYV